MPATSVSLSSRQPAKHVTRQLEPLGKVACRAAKTSAGPGAWSEWQCPLCGRIYAPGPGVCPGDEVALCKIVCSPVACLRPRLRPGVWWVEWRCPSCGGTYDRDLGVCPHDQAPLDELEFSMPFLWLG